MVKWRVYLTMKIEEMPPIDQIKKGKNDVNAKFTVKLKIIF